ncbi:MAG: hypothetical protein II192_03020 [Clostridia bacterium]|nr:hypothetical protein [Clostridia bacterium]
MNAEEKKPLGGRGDRTPGGYSRVVNVVAFIVCLVIAVSAWLYVMQTESPEYEETFARVAIEIENTSRLSQTNSLSVIGGWNASVEVKVKGKKSDIAKYTAEDLSASVDVGAITEPGVHSLDVSVRLPERLTFVSCYPSSVQVEVDYVATKTVRVEPRIVSASYGTEREIGDPVASPAEITVSGPSAVLETVASARVSLSLGELTGSVVAVDTVTLVDSEGEPIENPYLALSSGSVSVTVPVYEKKTVPLKVDYRYGYFNNLYCKVTIEPASVTLKGERGALESVDFILLDTLDEKQITSDITRSIAISVPEKTTLVDGVTAATVTVENTNTSQKTVTVTDIKKIGNGYELVTKSLEILLRGPTTIMDKIEAKDVTVTVDLTKLTGTGEIKVEANVAVASSFVYELGTYYVTVKKN